MLQTGFVQIRKIELMPHIYKTTELVKRVPSVYTSVQSLPLFYLAEKLIKFPYFFASDNKNQRSAMVFAISSYQLQLHPFSTSSFTVIDRETPTISETGRILTGFTSFGGWIAAALL